MTGPTIHPEHRDGLPWHDAPLPRRLHRCRPQTHAVIDQHGARCNRHGLDQCALQRVDRCACGAIRACTTEGNSRWIERNSRRRCPQGTT